MFHSCIRLLTCIPTPVRLLPCANFCTGFRNRLMFSTPRQRLSSYVPLHWSPLAGYLAADLSGCFLLHHFFAPCPAPLNPVMLCFLERFWLKNLLTDTASIISEFMDMSESPREQLLCFVHVYGRPCSWKYKLPLVVMFFAIEDRLE